MSQLGSEGFIRLAAQYTVARMLEREDFANRMKNQQPIAMHEGSRFAIREGGKTVGSGVVTKIVD